MTWQKDIVIIKMTCQNSKRYCHYKITSEEDIVVIKNDKAKRFNLYKNDKFRKAS